MDNTFKKLGFQELLDELQNLTKMQFSREKYLKSIQINIKPEIINQQLLEVEEAVKLLDTGVNLIDKDHSAMALIFPKLNKSGIVLFESDLKLVLDLLSTIDIILFAVQKNTNLKALNKLVETYDYPRALHDRLSHFILPTGELNINANPELKRVSKEINSISSSIREKAVNLLKVHIEKGRAASDAQPTIINGRIVLPLFSEYKRQVDGLIHDESASGQTTYIEPSSILNLNNELRELEIEERRIKYLIFKELTDQVSFHASYLKETLNQIAVFDFIIAKAKLAKQMGAEKPQLVFDKPVLDIKGARNPNLVLIYGAGATIPFDLKLDYKTRVLVLSGPNAGGKSVLLKTVGLLQLMLQAGMLLPIDSSSRLSVFNAIVADIGDDQSVQDELSTYTAHMTRMSKLLKTADQSTLFLLDEFGAGTDPESGGKIASEILLELLKAKSFGVVSTHYEEVKQIGSEPGGLNGAMQFDTKEMTPLYTLNVGTPGRSFAFEVAANVGVPQYILESAKARFTQDKISYDEKLKQLNEREVELEKNARNISKQQIELDKLQKQYQELVNFYQESKHNLLSKARQEVSDLLQTTRKQLDKISNAKFQKGTDSLKEAREEVKKIEERYKLSELPKPIVRDQPIKELKVGQKVKLIGSESVGEVLAISGQMVDVAIGELKLRVKKHTLVQGHQQEQTKNKQSHKVSIQQRQEFESTIDIRGKSGQEAQELLERYLDDALVLSVHEVKIIHGRGTGVLKKLVKSIFGKNKHVGELNEEHPDFGGDGVTIVKFA